MSHVSPQRRRRWWRRRRNKLDPVPDRSAIDRIVRYRARSYREWTDREQRGAVLVEAALIMPIVIMLMFGVVSVGLIILGQIHLEHAVGEAARGVAQGVLHEDTAAFLVEDAGGEMECFSAGFSDWCWDDGLGDVDRIQVVGSMTLTLPGPWWTTQEISARAVSIRMP